MSLKLDDETRLNFDKMLKESGAEDNTEKIRKLKHSDKIREQVTNMVEIQTKYSRLGNKGINKMIVKNKEILLFAKDKLPILAFFFRIK